MEKHLVVFYLGCGSRRNKFVIKLRSKGKVDRWNETHFHRQEINPDDITGIAIGPKTVLEIFSDPYYYRLRKVLKNPHNAKDKVFDIGCIDEHSIWRGIIRSLRVWDYDHYMNQYGVRKCETDNECRDNEKCLCESGLSRKEWCPKTGKRCMHKAFFVHNKRRNILMDDLVDMNCLKKKLEKYRPPYVTYRNIRDDLMDCSGWEVVDHLNTNDWRLKKDNDNWKWSKVEGFGERSTSYNLIFFILLIIIFVYLFKN